MVRAGYSPSVRLFEAAACATPILTDPWPGLARFFTPGDEILVARSAEDTLGCLRTIAPEEAAAIGARAVLKGGQSHFFPEMGKSVTVPLSAE